MESYKPYIPQDPEELVDLIGSMVLASPRFVDTSGFFPEKSLETVYFALVEGLKATRAELGEERYATLIEMAEQTKGWFAAAVDEDADDVSAGRSLLLDMIDILGEARPAQ